MPRQPRVDEAGGIYHAFNRGNARQRIFRKPEDYEAFLRTLADGLAKYPVELFAFCLMPNHWHLVVRPRQDAMMGRMLRWVTATHTQRYHAHYHSAGAGHLYQSRFKSFPVQDDAHFLVVCRYVERNALRAGLVRRAEAWEYGSLWRWLQRPEPQPGMLSPWPVRRSTDWVGRVNEPLTARELARPPALKKTPVPFYVTFSPLRCRWVWELGLYASCCLPHPSAPQLPLFQASPR